MILLLCFLAFSLCASAQTAPARTDSIVVTGTWEPLALDELDRSVTVLPIRSEELLLNSWMDALRLDPSIDLRERAPNGVQTDISIRGANFGQTLILLNGIRINDAQSGHHNLDLPIPPAGIARVEVLRGSGSTLYGSDAVGGVINVITDPPESSSFSLRTAAGNFGVNQERGALSLVDGSVAEQLTFSRDFSSGFRPDRDYRNLALASSTHWLSPLGASDVTLAYDDRPFGADQFYGNFNSWEDTKTWFGSLRQAIGEKTEASFAFRRHSDLFVLFRDQPEIFTNHHYVDSYVATLRRNDKLARNVSLHYGGEFYRDTIVSNNLGNHQRNYGAGYASIDVRALRRFSFSAGVRENFYGSLGVETSPNASAGVWLTSRLKLRGSVSHAFRLPTYTDLYYHDPANVGSPNLRPERAWSYETGLQWNPAARLRADVAIFHRRERDGIDFVRRSAGDIFRATNVDRLQFTGVETAVDARLSASQNVAVRYTAIHGAQAAFVDLTSKYVFNYPSQNAVAEWRGNFRHGALARTRVGVLNRRARDPYALWDIYGAWGEHAIRPFLQLTNITATQYEEIPGVVMPGRAILGGIEWSIGWK
ncbi:MAG TPA: TonB-dependent receptor [Bryobacteraceae bacterium]|nr:TonB-dependent receptor [Bryobacteraceae bacterium]